MHNNSTANSTQLVRYHLQLSPAVAEPQLVTARALLTEHGFLVDQLTPGEAVVASTQGTDPDWQPIREGFKQLGSAVAHITTAE